MKKEKGFIEIIVIFLIILIVSAIGLQKLSSIKKSFALENETQNILNHLTKISTSFKRKCLQIEENYLNIFDDKKKDIKKIKLNNKISYLTSTKNICCQNSISCTPSSITLKTQNFACKISISIRGQIKKICKKDLV